MTCVLLVRGHLVTPWELRPWAELDDRFDVRVLHTRSNLFDSGSLELTKVPVSTLRDRFPKGLVGEVITGVIGDRYQRGAPAAFASADIVHAEELSFWFAADAARRKAEHGFRLVQTVWETLPFLDEYRGRSARRNRHQVLQATDLFLAATERARIALLLEGVEESRVVVCPPGIDIDRFRAAEPTPQEQHVILSPGRLEWQKGHHDVLRAIALLHRGIVRLPDGSTSTPRLRIVGKGPEEERLRRYAAELGIGEHIEFGSVPYDDMPQVFADASCMLLASQSSGSGGYHPFDVPRIFWEEQFGMVFVEGMAAGLPLITTSNGAIPEVLDGVGTLVPAGDFVGMAEALAAGPPSRPPAERVNYPEALLERYSTTAMAARLAAAYERVLATDPV